MNSPVKTFCVLADGARGAYTVYGMASGNKKVVIVLYEKDPSAKTAYTSTNKPKMGIQLDGSEKVHYVPVISFNPEEKNCLFAHSAHEDEEPEMIAYFQAILTSALLRDDIPVYCVDETNSVQMFLDEEGPDIAPPTKNTLDPSAKAGMVEAKIVQIVTDWLDGKAEAFSLIEAGNHVYGELQKNMVTSQYLRSIGLDKLDIIDFVEELLGNMKECGKLKKGVQNPTNTYDKVYEVIHVA